MPELPEVEAARRAMEDNCVGKKILRAVVSDDSKVIDGVSRADLEASLVGKTIVSAHRKGKNMWLRLDSPPFPSFQFGMAGAVYIKGVAVTKYKRSAVKDTDEWPSKYSKVFVQLDDGMEFSFTDKRRFAKVRLLKDPSFVPPISELGPDALLEPMTVDVLFASLTLYQESAIGLLMKYCIKLGFIPSIVHPPSPKKMLELYPKASKRLLKNHLKLEQIVTSFLVIGFFIPVKRSRERLWLMGRKLNSSVGGRTSAFVPELQKLPGNQAAKAGSKRANKSVGHGDGVDDVDHKSDLEVKATAKSKKGRNPGGQAKKSSAKRKFKESDDEDGDSDVDEDDNDDNADEDRKNKTR